MKRPRALIREALPAVNRITERFGFVVSPVHYYGDSPSRRWLVAHEDLWRRPTAMRSPRWDLDDQVAWLRDRCRPFVAEVAGFATHRAAVDSQAGPGFGPVESQILHCVIRSTQPARIIEVGSGVSSLVALHAAGLNRGEGRPARVTCIEPHPSSVLRQTSQIELIAHPAQEVSLDTFQQLEAGDILFIDSSHSVRTGSELARLYLEVLPSLRPGVLVHVHDIYLPYVFSPWVLRRPFDWQETTLLAGLLCDNPHLLVRACLSALHHDRGSDLAALLPDYRPASIRRGLADGELAGRHYPSSIWMSTV